MSEDFIDCSEPPGRHVQKYPPRWEEGTQQSLTLVLLLAGAYEGNSGETAGIQVHSESFLQLKLWILINGLEGMSLVGFTEEFLRYFYYTKKLLNEEIGIYMEWPPSDILLISSKSSSKRNNASS